MVLLNLQVSPESSHLVFVGIAIATCIHMCAHTCINIHVHVCMHAYTHIHACTHLTVCSPSCPPSLIMLLLGSQACVSTPGSSHFLIQEIFCLDFIFPILDLKQHFFKNRRKEKERKQERERWEGRTVWLVVSQRTLAASVLLVESRLNVGLSSGSFLSFSFLSSSFIFANNFLNCRRVWRREENGRVSEQNRTTRMDCCHFVNHSFSSRIRLKFCLSSHSLAKNISLGFFAELDPLSFLKNLKFHQFSLRAAQTPHSLASV